MAEEKQTYYRVEVIASLFGVSVRRVQQLTQEGIISTTKTTEGNRYDLAPTIQKYIKYLSDKAYGKSRSEKKWNCGAETAGRNRPQGIAGEMHRLKTEIASGKYIDIEEVKMDYKIFCCVQEICTVTPSRLSGRISSRLDPMEAGNRERTQRGNHSFTGQLRGGRSNSRRKEETWQEIRFVDMRSHLTNRRHCNT